MVTVTSEYMPISGDELRKPGLEEQIYIDAIEDDIVYYRLCDGAGGLLSAVRRPVSEFRQLAFEQGICIVLGKDYS